MTRSEKVKLPSEVAKAIEKVNLRWTRSEIVEYHATGKGKWDISYLNTLDLDTLITALYIGYEVEETPEEKIWDFYHTKAACEMHPHHAIQNVLNILNIKIEGVNA